MTAPKAYPYAPKRDKPLSLWNPLDYILLLYWIFYFPQAIKWYIETFGSLPYDVDGRQAMLQDTIQRNLALQGLLLTVVTPFMLALFLRWLGLEIDLGGVAIGVTYGVVLGAALGVAYGVVYGVAVGVAGGLAFGLAFGVAVGLAFGVARDVVVGVVGSVAVSVAVGVAYGVAFGVAIGVAGGVAVGVAGGVVVGVAGGVAYGVAYGLVLGVAFGVALSLAFGLVISITSMRLDAALFVCVPVLRQQQQQNQPWLQRSSFLPIPTLQYKLFSHLIEDWPSGLDESEGLLRYSMQFIPVVFAIEQALAQMPSSLLLGSVTKWGSMPLYDWNVVRFQSATLRAGLQQKFWEGFFVLPSRWRPQLRVELRFDTPARAACAAFWLLHEGQVSDAANAFVLVRQLPHGEELFANTQAMAKALDCQSLEQIALWQARIEPQEDLLRPQVWEALSLFQQVAQDAEIVQRSRSSRQRNVALNRANGTLDGFLEEIDHYPTPERANLAKMAQQWLEILLSHSSQVATLEVREPVISPYIVGAIVPAERLVGRKELFSKIEGMWTKVGALDSLIIYGHRRMGKSSIVWNLLHFCQLGEDTALAVLNLQSVELYEGIGNLYCSIAFELWQAAVTSFPEPDPDEFEKHGQTKLKRLLAHLHDLHPERRYILILDEYELLDQELSVEIGRRFIMFLRGLTQQYHWLVMALVGLHTLRERSADYYEPIYGWRPIRVGLMDADGVADMLQIEEDEFPLEYSLDAVDLVHKLTGGQPFLVQLVGDSLVQRFNKQLRQQLEPPAPTFSANDVHAVVNESDFYEQGDAYFRGIWAQASQAPASQHALLQALAPHKAGMSQDVWQDALRNVSHLDEDLTALGEEGFNAALNALTRHDVVICEDRVCRYTVELMRRWVQKKWNNDDI